MSYDTTNVEKATLGVKFPTATHKLMVEELSRIVKADVTTVKHIANVVNKVPVKKIDEITINDLIDVYGLKV
jgi:hypothetical protein